MAMDTIVASYRFERATSEAIIREINKRYPGPDDPAAKVATVEYHLTVGHERFRHRRYAEALAAYRLAEGLLYSLVAPRFNPYTTLGDDVRLPVDRRLFTALAETALTSVRVTPDAGPAVAIGPRETVTVPPVLAHYTQVSPEPVVISGVLSDRVVTGLREGAQAVRAREFDVAVPLLERAIADAPDDQPRLRTGLARSLGVALSRGVRTDADAPGSDVAGSDVERPDPAGADAGSSVGAARVHTLRLAAGVTEAGLPRVVEISLGATDSHEVLRREIYQTRVTATTLEALGYRAGAVFLPGHFDAHVPHHYFYTVQLCLGDAYRKLGQYEEAVQRYERARDYQYLNLAIEAPVVWTRIAECLLDWGYELFRGKQPELAAQRFAAIVDVAADGARGLPAGSPLYGHAPFDAIAAAVTAYLPNLDAAPPAGLSLDMAIALRKAILYQSMIHAGLNVLGLPVDLIPVFRFRYLQAVARYFTDQAIKAERDYITFMSTSEQETASQLQLQQSVDLAAANVTLENRRVEEANAESKVADASRRLAQERIDNATERIAEYAVVSADKIALDTASAHASGGMTETEGGYSVSLGTSGETVNLGDQDYEILRSAAWHRGMIQREFELNDMERTKQEYERGRDLADAQLALSTKRVAIAEQGRAIAQLRQQQAQQLLDYSQNKTFDAALWSGLADRMRELARLYLDRAIEIAYIMQSAYNFENDTTLDVIAFNYGASEELNGLLGGQALMADIDYFMYHYVTQAKSKEIPVRTVLSLAEHFPFALYQFRRTGVATFETSPELFDRLYPGSYLHRMKAVEVVAEGVVPADGLNGTLRNSGVSIFRTLDNASKARLQPREVQVLSAYSLRGDAVVFRPSEEMLGVFEGSGACTAWTLAFPPGSNDVRYESITDIKVVLNHTAFYDSALELAVRAALPTTGQRARAFSLRESRPDAYFLLLETGSATFELDRGDFPYHHVSPTVTRIALIAVAENGGPAASLVVDLAATGSAAARATTGSDGTVASGGTTLDAFVGSSPLTPWQVGLDPAANPGFFGEQPPGSGVRRVTGLRDLVVAFDYSYTVRTTP